MAGHTILLNVLGGVALLLWGTRMVQAAILKAFGTDLRAAVCARRRQPAACRRHRRSRRHGAAERHRDRGVGHRLRRRGLVALPAALALMLGADLGTSLAVQALSLDLGALVPLLLIAGVALARASAAPAGRAGRTPAGRPRADPAGARPARRRLRPDARERDRRAGPRAARPRPAAGAAPRGDPRPGRCIRASPSCCS